MKDDSLGRVHLSINPLGYHHYFKLLYFFQSSNPHSFSKEFLFLLYRHRKQNTEPMAIGRRPLNTRPSHLTTPPSSPQVRRGEVTLSLLVPSLRSWPTSLQIQPFSIHGPLVCVFETSLLIGSAYKHAQSLHSENKTKLPVDHVSFSTRGPSTFQPPDVPK